MNFELNDDQLAIADLAGRIFGEQVTDESLRHRSPGIDRPLWELLAASGLTAASLPEEAGGSAMGQLELALMLEAQGRSLAPVPLGISSVSALALAEFGQPAEARRWLDRKSTRLNSSHVAISYAVFCLKKKKYNY